MPRFGGRATGRSWTGTSGKLDNCQLGVFFAYASEHGQALIDRELYLPTCWIEDEVRRADAKIGDEVGFATKPALARAIEAGCRFAG
ncbi:transposase [Streptomyces sp. V1I1]|uniref:transposase n=1 Tax=Streptomyces sp. V1I1 TaxID=3042272 RepID=UPI00277D2C7F|nr:transposase [Streptomyces sp. V1I1]MDQ0938677.1 SRSO17 transposase [Streptomyces sp. V1I1]